MQFTLTNDFTTGERALLHATLLHVINENKASRQLQKIQDAIEGKKGQAKIFEEFAIYTDATMQTLIQKLFHDCFLEDMDFIKEFAKQRNSALASNTAAVFEG